MNNTQKGFSLIEIMIGGLLLAGLGLAGASLFKNQRSSQSRLDRENALVVFHQQLSKFIMDVHNCNATFQDYYNSAIPAGDISIYSCNSALPGNCDVTKDAASSNLIRNPVPTFAVGTWTDKSEIWKIGSIRSSPLTNTGRTSIQIRYDLNPRLPGSYSVTKNISLIMRFSGGAFKECFNAERNSVLNLQNDLCKTLSPGNFSPINGKIAYWDSNSQTCQVSGVTDCTSPGLHIRGIYRDGSVNCRSITEGFDTGTIADSTMIFCQPPQTARLVYDTGAQKMRIQCL